MLRPTRTLQTLPPPPPPTCTHNKPPRGPRLQAAPPVAAPGCRHPRGERPLPLRWRADAWRAGAGGTGAGAGRRALHRRGGRHRRRCTHALEHGLRHVEAAEAGSHSGVSRGRVRSAPTHRAPLPPPSPHVQRGKGYAVPDADPDLALAAGTCPPLGSLTADTLRAMRTPRPRWHEPKPHRLTYHRRSSHAALAALRDAET